MMQPSLKMKMGRLIFTCSGNGLFQAKIDLNTGKLTIPNQFLDKKQPGWPEWMVGGLSPFVIKRDDIYFMFSTWTRGYEVGLLNQIILWALGTGVE